MDKILNEHRLHKWIIGITVAFFVVLTTIDTPFVFDGLFMSDFWDNFITGLMILLVVELNVLGIRQYPMFKRIYMHLFTVFYFILMLMKSDRIEYLLILLWVCIASGFFINDYYKNYKDSKQEYPRDRMLYIHFFSFLFVIIPLTDFSIIQDGRMALLGLGLGGLTFLVMILVFKFVYVKLRPYLEILLGMIVILPLGYFLLLAGLNYALDESIPETNEYEIVDLRVDSGARSVTTYKVYFVIDGKKEHIGVNDDLYYSLVIGDEIEVSVYEGFFGFQYLIHE